MPKGIYYKRRGISFTSTMVIYFSLIVFHDAFSGNFANSHLPINTIIMVGIYMLIGLASKDYKPLGMMIERVWNMNCQNGVTDDSKLQTIRAYIALNVAQWNRYWILYQQIVDEKEGILWGTKEKLKELLGRIPNGQLDLKQFIWILCYIAYNVIRNNDYIPFLPADMSDIDFIIDVAGLGFFTFSSGVVIGLGSFMEKIFE